MVGFVTSRNSLRNLVLAIYEIKLPVVGNTNSYIIVDH